MSKAKEYIEPKAKVLVWISEGELEFRRIVSNNLKYEYIEDLLRKYISDDEAIGKKIKYMLIHEDTCITEGIYDFDNVIWEDKL